MGFPVFLGSHESDFLIYLFDEVYIVNMTSTWQELSPIFFSAGVLLLTPGPTNTLLLFAGATAGFLKAQKLVLAEVAGYFIAINVWGFMIAILTSRLPSVVTIVKFFCVIYIYWLAMKIWHLQQKEVHEAVIEIKDVFLATLFNPKAFVTATYIMPKTVFIDMTLYPSAMLIFFFALLPVSAFWCISGRFLYLTKKERSTKNPVFFRMISLALGVFATSMLYNLLILDLFSRQT